MSVILSWEYADGSGGQCECADAEQAHDRAREIPGDARVWVGDEQVRQGFIAPDDVSWMW